MENSGTDGKLFMEIVIRMRVIFATTICGFLLLVCGAHAQQIPRTVFSEWKSKVDPAVERGLQFLAESQERNGSFPENYGTSTGIPSLVGMAFLSKGHMPTEGPYAANINRCIDYVLQHTSSARAFSSPVMREVARCMPTISALYFSRRFRVWWTRSDRSGSRAPSPVRSS